MRTLVKKWMILLGTRFTFAKLVSFKRRRSSLRVSKPYNPRRFFKNLKITPGLFSDLCLKLSCFFPLLFFKLNPPITSYKNYPFFRQRSQYDFLRFYKKFLNTLFVQKYVLRFRGPYRNSSNHLTAFS